MKLHILNKFYHEIEETYEGIEVFYFVSKYFQFRWFVEEYCGRDWFLYIHIGIYWWRFSNKGYLRGNSKGSLFGRD